jgi:hypothetical protein
LTDVVGVVLSQFENRDGKGKNFFTGGHTILGCRMRACGTLSVPSRDKRSVDTGGCFLGG